MYKDMLASMDPVIIGWERSFPIEPMSKLARSSLAALGLYVAASDDAYDTSVSSMVILMSFLGYHGGRSHLSDAFDRSISAPSNMNAVVSQVSAQLMALGVELDIARCAGVAVAVAINLNAVVKADHMPKLTAMRAESMEQYGSADDTDDQQAQEMYFNFGVGLSQILP